MKFGMPACHLRQTKRPPLAKIRPGSPAPAMGPPMSAYERPLSSKSNYRRMTASGHPETTNCIRFLPARADCRISVRRWRFKGPSRRTKLAT
jgi:hypothetical protein